MNEQKYYIPDIETGFKIEVPKETWERYVAMWEHSIPKINNGKCIPIILGTGGDMELGDDKCELFYKET
jgi:hypothetical protein